MVAETHEAEKARRVLASEPGEHEIEELASAPLTTAAPRSWNSPSRIFTERRMIRIKGKHTDLLALLQAHA